ncbi:MAG TPA: hypothetical protein VKT77_18735, partial [Chthonomonadaceae bacterium]|nr:hypothetical protein [Chthonomonadaceae bacterium]
MDERSVLAERRRPEGARSPKGGSPIGDAGRSAIRTARRYGKTAMMSASGMAGDGPLFLIDYLLRFVRVALLLAIWRTLFAGRRAVGGMPLTTVLTYTLIGEVFAEPMAGFTTMADAFWDGTITARFLRPMSLFGQFAAEAGGLWTVNFAL